MSDKDAEPVAEQPEKITRKEADRLNNFAQGLEDNITHVVDYGDLGSDKKEK